MTRHARAHLLGIRSACLHLTLLLLLRLCNRLDMCSGRSRVFGGSSWNCVLSCLRGDRRCSSAGAGTAAATTVSTVVIEVALLAKGIAAVLYAHRTPIGRLQYCALQMRTMLQSSQISMLAVTLHHRSFTKVC